MVQVINATPSKTPAPVVAKISAAAKKPVKAEPKKAVTKKAAAPQKAKEAVGKKFRFKPDDKITLLFKPNPHRKGTILFSQYAKYKNGMTVAEALDAGVLRINLNYLSGRKIIKIS